MNKSSESASDDRLHRWTARGTPEEIQEVHQYIKEVIEESGPFDGVMGFSEGASVVVSLLLQHEIDSPNKPPPFRFAILFSCGIVGSADIKFALGEYQLLWKEFADVVLKHLTGENLECQNNISVTGQVNTKINTGRLISSSDRKALAIELSEALASGEAELRGQIGQLVQADFKGTLEEVPRLYHPLLLPQRVRIPTVFCYGRSDPYLKQAEISKQLFDTANVKFVTHLGGHDIPRSAAELQSVVSATQWVIRRAQILSSQGRYC
jgi:predicted esterase